MSSELYDRTRDFNDTVYRNIVSVSPSRNLFEDIDEDDAELTALAQALEARVKQSIPADKINRGFAYTTAIEYPFIHEPYLASRYGDGTYGIWYGSLTSQTTIFETAYHMIVDELQIVNSADYGPITRMREVFSVHCFAILQDMSDKRKNHPLLIANDYSLTQQIGRRLHDMGSPGLLAPSVRDPVGTNVVIFKPAVLSNPRSSFFLTYVLQTDRQTVSVTRGSQTEVWQLQQDHFVRG